MVPDSAVEQGTRKPKCDLLLRGPRHFIGSAPRLAEAWIYVPATPPGLYEVPGPSPEGLGTLHRVHRCTTGSKKTDLRPSDRKPRY
jgi:hypothetical protein